MHTYTNRYWCMKSFTYVHACVHADAHMQKVTYSSQRIPHIHTYICIHTYVCMHTYVCTYTHTYVDTYIYTQVQTKIIHTYGTQKTYIHTYTNTCMYRCMYIHKLLTAAGVSCTSPLTWSSLLCTHTYIH